MNTSKELKQALNETKSEFFLLLGVISMWLNNLIGLIPDDIDKLATLCAFILAFGMLYFRLRKAYLDNKRTELLNQNTTLENEKCELENKKTELEIESMRLRNEEKK